MSVLLTPRTPNDNDYHNLLDQVRIFLKFGNLETFSGFANSTMVHNRMIVNSQRYAGVQG